MLECFDTRTLAKKKHTTSEVKNTKKERKKNQKRGSAHEK